MTEPFEYCGVRCTPDALLEVDGVRIMVTVQKKEIQQITLRHGIQAPNPTMQILFGLAMVALGYFPARDLIYFIRHGGAILEFEQLIFGISALGIWTIFEALKRGYFLEIQLPAGGSKRLAFAKRPDAKSLDELLMTIEKHCGVRVLREK